MLKSLSELKTLEMRRFKQHFTVYVRAVVVRKTGKQSED